MKYLTVFFLFILNFTFSQKNIKALIIASDCEKAINISHRFEGKYGPTIPPTGYGENQEIDNKNYKVKHVLEAEHNSSWYTFTAKQNGIFNLIIVPINKKNDYDFMLFKAKDSNTCQAIKKGEITPVRTNLSRTGNGLVEITGLHKNGKKDFVQSGIGNPFSAVLDVHKNEKYYLLVDNVYDKGNGHTVIFGYDTKAQFNGKVLTDKDKIVQGAEVKLKDEFGNIISETKSNAEGNYSIQTEINANLNHSISITFPKKFPSIITLMKEELKIKKYNLTSLNGNLPTLIVHEKYVLDGIYFVGNSDEPLFTSSNAMEALHELMRLNPTLKIRIEGHVNQPSKIVSEEQFKFDQTLSESRALRIYNFLIERGIASNRISHIGLNAKFMVYPDPDTEEQMEKNRRVEINILSF